MIIYICIYIYRETWRFTGLNDFNILDQINFGYIYIIII